MKFEERLSEIINEVDVPDELLPHNIAAMLKERSAGSFTDRTARETNQRNIKSSPAALRQKRAIIIRTSAAAAACAVLAVSTLSLRGGRDDEQQQLEAPISYEAVSPDSYGTLYDIYTGITVNGGDRPDSERTIDEINQNGAEARNAADGYSVYDFADCGEEKASGADIAKTDGNYMYCLKDDTLCIISLDTMNVISEIKSTLRPPVEIYAEDGKLILISKEKEKIADADSGNETAVPYAEKAENSPAVPDVPAKGTDTYQSAPNDSDIPDAEAPNDKTGSEYGEGKSAISGSASRTNAVVDIYDVSDPANPVHTASYKQNGSYVASQIADGVLYMATAYSDYRVRPLDTQDDLDSFVPAYYLNGKKSYIDAEDIIIPGGAASTDYTVVSAIKTGSADITASVKAVLGSSRNVYCSADTLYVAAVGKKDREYSVISSFDLSDGGISYRVSGSVDGAVLGQQSMNEYNGLFRIAAETSDENGKKSVSVYVLDRSLTVVNSAGQLFPEGKVSAVRFERNYARIIEEDSGKSVIVLDLSANPPKLAQSLMGNEAYLYGYSEDTLLGVGKSEDGKLTLTMYSSETGLAVNGTAFGSEEGETFSRALADRRAVLIDKENGIIGVPAYSRSEFGTKNCYYVYTYSEDGGFSQKGVIEYVDVDDSMIFKRGFTKNGTLYIMSCGRIISARLSDLKIIETYEY